MPAYVTVKVLNSDICEIFLSDCLHESYLSLSRRDPTSHYKSILKLVYMRGRLALSDEITVLTTQERRRDKSFQFMLKPSSHSSQIVGDRAVTTSASAYDHRGRIENCFADFL